MKKHSIFIITGLAFASSFFSSCGEDRSGEYYALIASKTWMYEVMQQNYLFYKDLPPEDQIDFFKKPEAFLKEVVSSQDQKNGVIFSHIDSVKPSRVMSNGLSFGLEGALVRHTSGNYYVHILYTEPNSPASEVGLKRGDWILSVDSQKISTSNYNQYFQQPLQSHKYRVARYDKEGKPDTVSITLPSPRIVEQPSVYLTKMITSGSKKAFYIMYNGFESADEDQLKAAFAQGMAESPDDIILDLRYNPGGYVSTAVLLSTILAPANAIGQNCVNLIYNDKINRTDSYSFDPQLLQGVSNVPYNHLYVLTTSNTASASELVINCLRPYLDDKLLQVGSTTFGKNVAQSLFTDASAPQLEFWLTTSYISNSQNFYEYHDGLNPDYELVENVAGELGELGTAQDSLLRPVLYHLENGHFPSANEPSVTHASRIMDYNQLQVVHHPIADKPKRTKIETFR